MYFVCKVGVCSHRERLPFLWPHAQVSADVQGSLARVELCAWSWVIAIAEPQQGANPTIRWFTRTVILPGGYTRWRFIAFIPPCTHVVLVIQVFASFAIAIFGFGVEQVISTRNDDRYCLPQPGTGIDIGVVETDIAVIAQVPDERPDGVVHHTDGKQVLSSIVFLVERIDLLHDNVDIGCRLHVDHHFVRAIGGMYVG